MPETDYRQLCKEIFGTDNEPQIRKLAAKWKMKNPRNAGRKKALTVEDIATIEAMRINGVKVKDIAAHFGVTRQCISRCLNDRPSKDYTMRIDYMLGKRVCTIIYVDFGREQIKIQNRTDDVLTRAFGLNENPTWQDFEQFLVSRCFPPSRGYAKMILRGLGVNGYDPLEIAEVTSGRTAEDNMYLTFRTYPKEVTAYAAN